MDCVRLVGGKKYFGVYYYKLGSGLGKYYGCRSNNWKGKIRYKKCLGCLIERI